MKGVKILKKLSSEEVKDLIIDALMATIALKKGVKTPLGLPIVTQMPSRHPIYGDMASI